jgi:triphosphoribosyl-dephospho-CoA synthase
MTSSVSDLPDIALSSACLSWQRIDEFCCQALKREADAWPKPGLVTPVDSGSHRDMNYASFIDSIASLRGYFSEIAEAGAHGASYPVLQRIALAAEARMLAATRGANTHRGAIFNLGLLAAAAGMRQATPAMAGWTCGRVVAHCWGSSILAARSDAPVSHGKRVWQQYGVGGAREEAAAGFPTVYGIGVPVLRSLLAKRADEEEALVGTLMAIMAALPDTNLLWRGGEAGLRDVRTAAFAFNAEGSVLHPAWRMRLEYLHRWMVHRNLSPGGSADLVAASWLVHCLEPAAVSREA